jgi:hypothetical protein
MIIGRWRLPGVCLRLRLLGERSVHPRSRARRCRCSPAARRYTAARRSCKSPRLFDQPSGSRLTLRGAQRLQQEGDFSDPPGPLAHISLQYEVLALAGDEREGRELGHQHGKN